MAQIQRGIIPYSNLVKTEAERLLPCLRDSSLEVISYLGWGGLGRWRIVECATRMAMEAHLFDVLIWLDLPLNELKSRGKLQMRIAQALEIQSRIMDPDGEIDIYTSVQIYEKLKERKSLLVMGSASFPWTITEHIDLAHLAGIGVPNLRRGGSKGLFKVALVGDWKKERVDKSLRFYIDESRSAEFWELTCEEVALAADLPSTKDYFSFDTIMHFLSYFSLSSDDHYYSFLRDTEWMVRYWIAERLTGGEMEEDGILVEKMGTLLTELEDRSILWWDRGRLRIDPQKERILRWGMDGRIPDFHPILWVSKDSLPKENQWGAIQRMSLVITERIAINLPASPKCPNLSALVLRFGAKLVHFDFPKTFFNHMNNLSALDLVRAPIESLPSSLSSLCNLKLLMLRNCGKLVSLPTSLRDLIRLEFLDLSCCGSLNEIPESSFELMDRLRILDLSETLIDSLPSSLFSKLHNLQQLLLPNCRALKYLPSSLSNLVSLKKLNLSHCMTLKTGVSPQSLQNLTSLEELDLSYCVELEDIRDASFQNILPKLRRINIFSTISNCLSFRGCQSIETLNLGNLPYLEVLDASGTKIKTLDVTNSSDQSRFKPYSLRRLDILPTRYSDVLFNELNWREGDDGARIWVSNSHFFISTLQYSSGFFEAPCFSRFYIRISPYEEGCMPMTVDKFHNIHLKKSTVVYGGIYHSHTQTHHLFSHFTSRSSFDRHLEIYQCNSSPEGVDELLARTELITLLFNNSVERVTDLCDASLLLWDLKECRIGGCQRIKNVFSVDEPDLDILPSLKVVWVSDLPQLIALCSGVYGAKSFAFLKHIYMEHCPRLVTLFTSGVYLHSLETLEIKFCCRLENVFANEALGGKWLLQNLRSLCLLHVPKLKSICNDLLPELEKVEVQRCPKLRKLPIQVSSIDTSSSLPAIEIRGETKWWKSLQWDNNDERNKRPAYFRPWRRTPTTMQLCGLEW